MMFWFGTLRGSKGEVDRVGPLDRGRQGLLRKNKTNGGGWRLFWRAGNVLTVLNRLSTPHGLDLEDELSLFICMLTKVIIYFIF